MRVPREPLTWSSIPESLPEAEMSEVEMGLARIMTDVYYMTAFQIAELMNWKEENTRYHVSAMQSAGYLQGVYVTWRGKRWRVYAPSRHVASVLRAADPDWAVMHGSWQSPADLGVKGYAILHSLDRNLFCQEALANAYHWQWPARWDYQVRPLRAPVSGRRVIPDAVLRVQKHVWYVEMERSWRLSTITSKLARYTELYQHQTWGLYDPVLPRVLIVADTTSTQRRAMDAWLDHLDVLAANWVVLLPWEELSATWQCWVWSPTGERVQMGWRDLHWKAVQPTPATRRVLVPRRRTTPPDTPWLE